MALNPFHHSQPFAFMPGHENIDCNLKAQLAVPSTLATLNKTPKLTACAVCTTVPWQKPAILLAQDVTSVWQSLSQNS